MKLLPSAAIAGSLLSALLSMGACGLDWTVPEKTEGSQSGEGGRGSGGASTSGASTGAVGGGAGIGGTGAAAASSTSGVGASATSSTVASTGTGAPACDTSGSCDACDDCAINRGCSMLFDACNQNQDCADLDACVYGTAPYECNGDLGNGPCLGACYAANPGGTNLYDDLMYCVLCTECGTACQQYQATWGGC
jgi:hypothetical protein